MPRYQFNIEPQDGAARSSEIADYRSDSAARSHAGALSKKHKCPVDLARAGDEPWDERYLTTAFQSEHHASGFAFERIV